jgi:hypothetical protein
MSEILRKWRESALRDARSDETPVYLNGDRTKPVPLGRFLVVHDFDDEDTLHIRKKVLGKGIFSSLEFTLDVPEWWIAQLGYLNYLESERREFREAAKAFSDMIGELRNAHRS